MAKFTEQQLAQLNQGDLSQLTSEHRHYHDNHNNGILHCLLNSNLAPNDLLEKIKKAVTCLCISPHVFNRNFKSPIDLALEKGYLSIAKYLLTQPFEIDEEHLHYMLGTTVQGFRIMQALDKKQGILGFFASRLCGVDVLKLLREDNGVCKEKYIAHLQSLAGRSVAGHNLTGFYEEEFLPLRIRSIVEIFMNIQEGFVVDELLPFESSQSRASINDAQQIRIKIRLELLSELKRNLQTLWIERYGNTIQRYQEKNDLLMTMHQGIIATIKTLKQKESIIIAAGWEGHAIYLQIKKDEPDAWQLMIHNLGQGMEWHNISSTTNRRRQKKYLPYLLGKLNPESWKERDSGFRYLAEVLSNRFPRRTMKEMQPIVYDKNTTDNPSRKILIVPTIGSLDVTSLAMPAQTVGNCAVSNHDAARRAAIAPFVFDWILCEERKVSGTFGPHDEIPHLPEEAWAAEIVNLPDLPDERLLSANRASRHRRVLQETEIPYEFLCPITYEIMNDPVVITSGRSYERAAITEWFKSHSIDPMSREILASLELIPNRHLKEAIASFLEMKPHLKREDQIEGDFKYAVNLFVTEQENRLREEEYQQKRRQNNAKTLANKGRKLEQRADDELNLTHLEAALEKYETAQLGDPSVGYYAFKTAYLLHRLKRDEEALSISAIAVTTNAPYSLAYCLSGWILYTQKNYAKALEAFETATQVPSAPLDSIAEAYRGKGWTLCKQKQYQKALEAFEKSITLVLVNTAPSKLIRLSTEDSNAQCGKGWALIHLKKYKEALEAFEESLRLCRDDARAYHGKAGALNGMNRQSEALIAIDEAIRLRPSHPEQYATKSWICSGTAALEAAKKAVELEPNTDSFHAGLCWKLCDNGHYAQALKAAEQAVRLSSEVSAFTYCGYGMALVGLKEYQKAKDILQKSLAISAHPVIAWKFMAKALMQLKDYADALKNLDAYINDAIKLNLDIIAESYNKGFVLQNLKRYSDALEVYEKVIELDSEHKEAYLGKGQILLELDRPKDALVAFAKLIELDTANAEAYNGEGEALRALERYAEALSKFDKALSINSTIASAHCRKAWCLMSLNHPMVDILLCHEAAITHDPTETSWYAAKCWCLTLHGQRHKEALAVVEESLSIQPNGSAYLYCGKGFALQGLNKYEEAKIAYEKAIEFGQPPISTFDHYAQVLIKLKKYDKAITAYKNFINSDQNGRYVKKAGLSNAHQGIGFALQKLNHYTEALANFEKAIELNPQNNDANLGKGETLLKLNRNEEALIVFTTLIGLNATSDSIQYGKGKALYKLMRYAEALPFFTEAIRLNPENAEAHQLQGWIFYKLERNIEAAAAFSAAIDLVSTNAENYFGRGLALAGLHQYTESLAALAESLHLNTNNADVYAAKGCILLVLGRYEDALATFNKALEIDPDNAESQIGKGMAVMKLRSSGTHNTFFANLLTMPQNGQIKLKNT